MRTQPRGLWESGWKKGGPLPSATWLDSPVWGWRTPEHASCCNRMPILSFGPWRCLVKQTQSYPGAKELSWQWSPGLTDPSAA